MRDELKDLWKPEAPLRVTRAEKEKIMTQAQAKLSRLERGLRNRELREILPTVLIAAVFGARLATADTAFVQVGAAAMILASCWVAYYMLKHGRGPAAPSPALNLNEYRAGARAQYDHQIWLLSRVKYWYVAPIFAGVLITFLAAVEERAWRFTPFDIGYLIFLVVFCGFVIWLNESWGVRKLSQERDELTALLDD